MDKSHGSPYDRGRADAYYGRSRDPHWYPNGSYEIPRISSEYMTAEQRDEYMTGYDNEPDRKYSYSDWEVNA